MQAVTIIILTFKLLTTSFTPESELPGTMLSCFGHAYNQAVCSVTRDYDSCAMAARYMQWMGAGGDADIFDDTGIEIEDLDCLLDTGFNCDGTLPVDVWQQTI